MNELKLQNAGIASFPIYIKIYFNKNNHIKKFTFDYPFNINNNCDGIYIFTDINEFNNDNKNVNEKFKLSVNILYLNGDIYSIRGYDYAMNEINNKSNTCISINDIFKIFNKYGVPYYMNKEINNIKLDKLSGDNLYDAVVEIINKGKQNYEYQIEKC